MMPKITIIMPVYNRESLVKRALDSLPIEKEFQYIILDDGSTDGSWKKIVDWYEENENKIGGSIIMHWQKNEGVAKAMNFGFDFAKGEYIVSLSSDDYYVTNFRPFMKYLDGKNDLVYFDLQINNGEIWHLDKESKEKYVGAVKFIRRDFLGDIRIPDLKWHEDVPFSKMLYDKKPKEAFSGVVLKHYNYPNKGSLTWQANN